MKTLIMTLTILCFALLIEGCATESPEQSIAMACQSSPVLYTDLDKAEGDRHYALTDGHLCPYDGGYDVQ